MTDLPLSRIIDLQKLSLKLRDIKRITYVPGAGYENDVEHSYTLAVMAWLMAPKVAPQLDSFRLTTYALIHDLVEVYAGDTFCFGSEEDLASKPLREAQALRRLTDEFADFPSLVESLQSYDSQDDEESRFIYALDKLQGIIINYLDGGRVWHENDITMEQMISNKLEKTEAHPVIYTYVQKMAVVLRQEPELFPSSDDLETAGVFATV